MSCPRLAASAVHEGIADHDGVVAVGAGGQQRDRRADQFFHPAHILDGVGGKLGPAAGAGGGFAPAFQGLVDGSQAGLQVGAWTVNDRARMRELLAWGIDRLYTDDPGALLELRAGR